MHIFNQKENMFETLLDAFKNVNAGCEVHLMLHLYEYFELILQCFVKRLLNNENHIVLL